MTLPSPRMPADNQADKALFLAACEHIFDHCRAASRAQLVHGARMITLKLGGTLLVMAESTVSKRDVPEVAYVSEGIKIAGIQFS
jgi:hypothetical protein